MNEVLAVVTSWKRPGSIPIVIESLRNQSVPVHVCLLACAQGTDFGLPVSVRCSADTLIEFHKNDFGPCSRFIPPLMMPQFKWTLFAVDDHLMGPRYVEHLLATAERLNGKFATIGQQGRNLRDGELSGRRVMPQVGPEPADCIITSELCLTADVPHALTFRSELLAKNPSVSTFEDDLILCMGIQKAKGYPSIVAPAPDVESCWNTRRLDAPHALSARPNHRELRNEFVRTAIDCGWESKRGSCC